MVGLDLHLKITTLSFTFGIRQQLRVKNVVNNCFYCHVRAYAFFAYLRSKFKFLIVVRRFLRFLILPYRQLKALKIRTYKKKKKYVYEASKMKLKQIKSVEGSRVSLKSERTTASSVRGKKTYPSVKLTRKCTEDREGDILNNKNDRRASVPKNGAEDECRATNVEAANGAETKSPNYGEEIDFGEESSVKLSDEWSTEALQKLAEEKKHKATKHIHPCICDLPKQRKAAIEQFLKEKRIAQQKFQNRVLEIEEEIRLAEEREAERLRELEAEKEFYGDEYEMEGKKKKRKKRSARRASMVSLGVKQVINWRKSPRIQVRYTRTSNMRAHSSTYCKPPFPPLPEIKSLNVNLDGPDIPIRATRTVELRTRRARQVVASLREQEVKVKYPKRPPFVTKLW